MKKLILIFVSFFFFSSSMIVAPDPSEEGNAHIKAIYIYNFTKYIEWPENYKQGNFVVGVYGNNTTLLAELTKMATIKMVGTQKMEVKSFTNANDVTLCHLLFITSDNSSQLGEVLSKFKNKSTLIVTDKPGLAKSGSAINFVVADNKQKIELNRNNIEKYNLKVASNLVDMAISVN